MTIRVMALARRTAREEAGQVLPLMAFLTVLFLGITGLTVDLGHAYVCYRELQASTDAAAMSGAWAMSQTGATTTSIRAAVNTYSSLSTGLNANTNLPSPSISTAFSCISSFTSQVPCSSTSTNGVNGYNALQVRQSAIVPTLFIRALAAFGIRSAQSITLTAVSSAAMQGSVNPPYNVALVVDTTGTMANQDSDCSTTRIGCALKGMQQLMTLLTPCANGTSGSTCSGYDSVTLFTFPAIQANTASSDTSCPTTRPTTTLYYAPTANATTWTAPTGSSTTYQVTGYSNDYLTGGGAVSGVSALGAAAGGKNGSTNCKGLQTPNGQGGSHYEGTFYAGAIYAAASSLAAKQTSNPGTYNALIILSDGDASACFSKGSTNNYSKCEDGSTYGTQMDATAFNNSNGTYPSYLDQCQQGIAAANFAKTIPNTTVFTIAYGASNKGGSSGCATDTSGPNPGISPCSALQAMASAPADFYSDSTAAQNKGQCVSAANSGLNLSGIFASIHAKFTQARLLPNSLFGS